MGCTSGKAIKKKTTSIEDVSGGQKKDVQANANTTSASPNKNGQVVQGKQPKNESTNAIQIPGTNKSFLAPDGIPFIDEDVESDTEAETLIPNATVKAAVVADQNKNVISSSSQHTTTTVTKTSSSALGDGSKGTVETVMTTRVVETSHQGEGQPQVVKEILEIEMRQPHNTAPEHDANRLSAEVSNQENTVRQQEVAATKIQAGIRGFLDRKKVKQIRANQQNSPRAGYDQDSPAKENYSGEGEMNDRYILTEKHVDVRYPEEDDPKLNSAATKIQANYKGYKTRKEIKLKK